MVWKTGRDTCGENDKEGMNMQGKGPLNRKKNVTGTASEDSMSTQGPGMGTGPVGNTDGYQDRKEQQAQGGAPGRTSNPPQGNVPLNRPKQTAGQAPTGSMNNQGAGQGRTPQHARPQNQGTPQGRPFNGQNQQQRPQQMNSFTNQQRPQQNRPQQTFGQQRPQQSQNRPAQPPPQQQKTQQQFTGGGTPASSGNQTNRASGGKKSPMLLIIVAVAALLLGGGGLGGLFGGGSNTSSSSTSSGLGSVLNELAGGGSTSSSGLESLLGGGTSSTSSGVGNLLGTLTGGDSGGGITSMLGSLLGGYSSDALGDILGGSWFSSQTGYGSSSSAYNAYNLTQSAPVSSYSGTLNRDVAAGSRDKYTVIKGNGKDKVTVMVYLCGADLESRGGMATKDLQEMLNASFGSNLKLIVFSGGCSNWRNNMMSGKVNQIWQIENGKLKSLNDNAGTGAMTNPATLSSFIQYCAKNFKANRYALVLWDHGSGSVSGYGYDERNTRAGSMTLAGLNQAFQDGGVKFDFIGFDTCLMGTVENALMCSNYADYLIASEETEPGIGWYYTDWLTAWGSNTSMATLDIGKQICDDFVSKCASSCRGQQTTLAMIDLAELENTVPNKLKTFSQSVSSLVTGKQYKTVSNARNGSREFGTSASVDMVDLTDLCNKLNTKESAALAKVIQSSVKYNRTGNISSAYGLSIYFPYKKMSNVDKAVRAYEAIGMDDSYAKAIRAFAQVESSGQAVSSGSSSAMYSLFDMLGSSGGSSASSSGSSDLVSELLSFFLGGGYGRVGGLDSGNTSFLSNREISDSDLTAFLADNMLDAGSLVFKADNGSYVLDMKPEQWALVTGAAQNVFYDNGEGYVDLGLDNLFTFDDQGRMVADMDGTWLALNGQPVPYYVETAQYLDNGGWIITGRVPAMLNDQRVNLLIVFDNENENGYVAGARAVYGDETDMVAKAITEIQDGDTIQFLADLYDYQQNYTDSYRFGKPLTVSGAIQVSSVYLPDKTKALVTYRFTDIYNQTYWTPVIGK